MRHYSQTGLEKRALVTLKRWSPEIKIAISGQFSIPSGYSQIQIAVLRETSAQTHERSTMMKMATRQSF